ncbi:MAG: glycosyltransferase [Candidatus Rokubacteria bacterium]|nr:glycosyltransferase [Candidatus Rokubacteria bacterium]
MPETPLVSVVISNYNYARFLGEAVESVLKQTYRHREIIVVDDGSTDDSPAVVRRFGDAIQYHRQPNQGVSTARNFGARASHGELIAFLDSDDAWLPEKLKRQIPLFAKRDVGMVYAGLRYVDASGRPLGMRTSGRTGRVLREIALLRGPGVPASGSSAVVRRRCFEQLGGFDPDLSTGADWDLWRRIACHWEIDLIREPLVLYRLHGRGMHRNLDVFEYDKMVAFAKMFADPAATEVHRLRRRCYGNLYMTLSGSHYQAGNVRQAVRFALRAISTWPPAGGYLLAFPLRHLRRRLSGEESQEVPE